MADVDHHRSTQLYQLAMHKATAVLGRDRARHVIDGLLHDLGIELHAPRDLLALSQAMTELGGFEGAVGAMLGVLAIMRGAGPSSDDGGAESRQHAVRGSESSSE